MISVTYFGVLVLWAPKIQDKLHAFGPNFKEIEENVLFDEPEDVYDLDLVNAKIFLSKDLHLPVFSSRLRIFLNRSSIWPLIFQRSRKQNCLKETQTVPLLQRPSISQKAAMKPR